MVRDKEAISRDNLFSRINEKKRRMGEDDYSRDRNDKSVANVWNSFRDPLANTAYRPREKRHAKKSLGKRPNRGRL